MQKKFTAIAMALAVGVLGYATSAGAQTVRTKDFAETCAGFAGICITPANTNSTWGDDEDTVILDKPLFIVGGAKLTILPGVTVRGNPRSAATAPMATLGTPGTLIVTQSGEIDAQGTGDPAGVIVMTTAALDNNGDNQPDDLNGNAQKDAYPGFDPALSNGGVLPCTCAPVSCVGPDGFLGTGDDTLGTCVLDATPSFLDDTPRTAPLAPLTPPISPDPGLGPDGIDGTSDDTGGDANVSLWGGVIINGQAPTNLLGAKTTAADDRSFGIVEGLTVPGFPEAFAVFGGVQPHDSSGIVTYVEVRHSGDELGVSNELNGFTLAGVGDGTVFHHNSVYSSFDDGFEWFGGTVNSSYLMVSHIGDDGFDVDEGHTGVTQFGVYIAGNYNELDCTAAACPISGGNPDGGIFGTESGDQFAENDGEDCTLSPVDCNKSGTDGDPALATTDFSPWPMQSSFQYNFTAIGNAEGNDIPGSGAPVPDYEGNSQCTGAGAPFICCTGVGAGFCENSANSGIEMRNGWAGEVRNSILVGTGTLAGLITADTSPGFWATFDNVCRDYDLVPAASNGDLNGDLVRVVATTQQWVAEVSGDWPQPNVPWTAGAPTVAGSGSGPPASAACVQSTISQVLENGDALTDSGVLVGNLVNFAGFAGLVDPDVTFRPYGTVGGKLAPGLKTTPSDLRPVGGLGSIGGITPGGHPVADPNATYRGAFESGGDVWTDGWTALSIGGVN